MGKIRVSVKTKRILAFLLAIALIAGSVNLAPFVRTAIAETVGETKATSSNATKSNADENETSSATSSNATSSNAISFTKVDLKSEDIPYWYNYNSDTGIYSFMGRNGNFYERMYGYINDEESSEGFYAYESSYSEETTALVGVVGLLLASPSNGSVTSELVETLQEELTIAPYVFESATPSEADMEGMEEGIDYIIEQLTNIDGTSFNIYVLDKGMDSEQSMFYGHARNEDPQREDDWYQVIDGVVYYDGEETISTADAAPYKNLIMENLIGKWKVDDASITFSQINSSGVRRGTLNTSKKTYDFTYTFEYKSSGDQTEGVTYPEYDSNKVYISLNFDSELVVDCGYEVSISPDDKNTLTLVGGYGTVGGTYILTRDTGSTVNVTEGHIWFYDEDCNKISSASITKTYIIDGKINNYTITLPEYPDGHYNFVNKYGYLLDGWKLVYGKGQTSGNKATLSGNTLTTNYTYEDFANYTTQILSPSPLASQGDPSSWITTTVPTILLQAVAVPYRVVTYYNNSPYNSGSSNISDLNQSGSIPGRDESYYGNLIKDVNNSDAVLADCPIEEEGYKFKYWTVGMISPSTNNICYPGTYIKNISYDTSQPTWVFWAQWQILSYNLTVKNGDSETVLKNIPYQTNIAETLTKNGLSTPKKDGYTFVGYKIASCSDNCVEDGYTHFADHIDATDVGRYVNKTDALGSSDLTIEAVWMRGEGGADDSADAGIVAHDFVMSKDEVSKYMLDLDEFEKLAIKRAEAKAWSKEDPNTELDVTVDYLNHVSPNKGYYWLRYSAISPVDNLENKTSGRLIVKDNISNIIDPNDSDYDSGKGVDGKLSGNDFSYAIYADINKTENADLSADVAKKLSDIYVDDDNLTYDDVYCDESDLRIINTAKSNEVRGVYDLRFVLRDGNTDIRIMTVKVTLVGLKSDAIIDGDGNITNKTYVTANSFTYGIHSPDRNTKTAIITEDIAISRANALGFDRYEEPTIVNVNSDELAAIVALQESEKVGTLPLTFTTEDGATLTINVTLTDMESEDVAGKDTKIYANDFTYGIYDENGNANPILTEEMIKELANVSGIKDNKPLDLSEVTVDAKELIEAQENNKSGTYKVTITGPDGTTIIIEVTLKDTTIDIDIFGGDGSNNSIATTIVEGFKDDQSQDFSYKLAPQSDDAPLPNGTATGVTKEITVTATNKTSDIPFGRITFTSDDAGKTFVYRISQDNDLDIKGKASYKLDSTTYILTIKLYRDANGKFVCDKSIEKEYKKGGKTVYESADKMEFINTYVTSSGSGGGGGTGTVTEKTTDETKPTTETVEVVPTVSDRTNINGGGGGSSGGSRGVTSVKRDTEPTESLGDMIEEDTTETIAPAADETETTRAIEDEVVVLPTDEKVNPIERIINWILDNPVKATVISLASLFLLAFGTFFVKFYFNFPFLTFREISLRNFRG